MERNYKTFLKNGKWYIEYEFYSIMDVQWKKTLFRSGIDGKLIIFYTEKDANDWITAREEIISI